MLTFFSIICIYLSIHKSSGNPIINNTNITAIEDFNTESQLICDRNVFLNSNQSLYEVNIENNLNYLKENNLHRLI